MPRYWREKPIKQGHGAASEVIQLHVFVQRIIPKVSVQEQIGRAIHDFADHDRADARTRVSRAESVGALAVKSISPVLTTYLPKETPVADAPNGNP